MGKFHFSIHRWFSARYLLGAVGCLGIMNMYALRVNLSIAMVKMVNSTIQLNDNAVNASECNSTYNTTSAEPQSNGEFVWDEYEQGIILGSFYWGYILTQIPGGRLAELFSASWVFGLGVLVASSLFLTAVAARQGVWYLVALRVAIGLAQGFSYPTLAYLLGSWCTPWERCSMMTIVYSGASLGSVYGTLVAGTVTELWGWPYAFYVTGIVGVVWFVLWKAVAYDNPNQHPWISEEEKSYIESNARTSTGKKSNNIPWKSIAISLPLWSIIICHFCNNWLVYTFNTDLPTYMQSILHYDIRQNSIRSSMPYLAAGIFSIACSLLCDFLIKKQFLSIITARKTFNSIGFFIPSLMLYFVTTTELQQEAYILIALSAIFNAVTLTGFFSNLLDVGSTYSGTLTGISNLIATIPGWVGPYIVGYLTKEQSTRHQWNKVFYIMCGLNIFAGLIFLIFATSEEQSWNKQQTNTQQNENTEIPKKSND